MTSAGTMLVAGGLYGVRPWLSFLAGGLLLACSIPVLLSMPRSKRTDGEDGLIVVEALSLIRRRLTEPPLRSFVLYVALFFGIVNTADTFIQLIAIRTLGLSTAGLGSFYTGFTVVAAIASYHAGTIENLLSTRWAVLLILGVVAAFFVVPLLAPLAAFPLFFKPLAGVAADATTPLVAVAALGGFFALASVVVCAVETPVADAETEKRTAD